MTPKLHAPVINEAARVMGVEPAARSCPTGANRSCAPAPGGLVAARDAIPADDVSAHRRVLAGSTHSVIHLHCKRSSSAARSEFGAACRSFLARFFWAENVNVRN
jgi:hypothetical protein